MDLSIITEFIRPELLLLGVFLYCVGMFLKLLPAFKAEWAIPLIILGVSVVITIPYMAIVLGLGWSGALIITAIIQAVLLAALCVFANQLFKQLVEKRKAE